MLLFCFISKLLQTPSTYEKVKELVFKDSQEFERDKNTWNVFFWKYSRIHTRLTNLNDEKIKNGFLQKLFLLKTKPRFSDEIIILTRELKNLFHKRFVGQRITHVMFQSDFDNVLTQYNYFKVKNNFEYLKFLRILKVIIEEEDKK